MQNALDLKGKGPILAVSRELAWRKERRGWAFRFAHLPTERNNVADALSRLSENPVAFPEIALSGAWRRDAPDVKDMWKARLD